ncbi:hypothetical protein BDV11DRAFT_13476 [Aspergillus similis]
MIPAAVLSQRSNQTLRKARWLLSLRGASGPVKCAGNFRCRAAGNSDLSVTLGLWVSLSSGVMGPGVVSSQAGSAVSLFALFLHN